MNAPLSEAEWEQAEQDEPTELEEAWKPAAVAIGCIVVALALVAVLA